MQDFEKEERLKKAYHMASEMFNSNIRNDEHWFIDDKYFSYLQQYRAIANSYIHEVFKNWKNKKDKLEILNDLFSDISSSQSVFVLAVICDYFKENELEDDTYFKDILSYAVSKKAVELLMPSLLKGALNLFKRIWENIWTTIETHVPATSKFGF